MHMEKLQFSKPSLLYNKILSFWCWAAELKNKDSFFNQKMTSVRHELYMLSKFSVLGMWHGDGVHIPTQAGSELEWESKNFSCSLA